VVGFVYRRAAMNADELKAAIAALPPMEPVEPAHTWEFWAYDLRQNILNNNPEEFLTWPVIKMTMFVGNAPYIETEAKALHFNKAWAIEEPGFGKPEIYKNEVPCLVEPIFSSGNLIHQGYHLQQWEDKTICNVRHLDTIVEIGGGYGAMAWIVHRLGFTGRYIIFDLSEFGLLQQYYLSNVGVEGVEFKTRLSEPLESDLLIGLFSLSEMPLKMRGDILNACPARSYLFTYMPQWGGWDSIKWAFDLMKDKDAYLWHMWKVGHGSYRYLVGDLLEDH
jgi:hypothetical protein